jgi:hypothetical protein
VILNSQNYSFDRYSRVLSSLVVIVFLAIPAGAQTTATLRGSVLDTQKAALPGATIQLLAPLGGFDRLAVADIDGAFQMSNVPLGQYELRVTLSGFAPHKRTIELRTSVPLDLSIVLEIAALSTSVTVVPEAPLVDPDSTGTRHTLSVSRIERLPVAVGSRGLEAVLSTFPGFAQNANGAIHPRGAHNQMTYVVDGLAISDQLTGAFANALDASVVQSAELMTGNIPAEFGSKVSGVAIITSRSGLGTGRRLAGDVLLERAGFGTWHGAVQAGGGSKRVGYFGSVTTMRTDRFLDQITTDNLHNGGAFTRGFARIDLPISTRDVVRVQAMGGRSAFQLANLRSQEAAGQDQRQILNDASVWASHLRTLNPLSTLETITGYRTTRARLLPSAHDTPVTAWQDRRLATLTVSTRYSRVIGRHSLRAGADGQWFPIHERFTMAITDARFNDPASESSNAALFPFDVSRGGVPFAFEDRRTGRLLSTFGQATIRWPLTTISAGLRYDDYRLLVHGRYLQPRLGLTYRFSPLDVVLRASYNRNYQTPPNENLLLSSSEAASQLAPARVREALGGTHQPIRAERQDVYEIGAQRAIGALATLDVSFYRKDSRDQQDNNNFFNTGIIFPTTLRGIHVTGAEGRLTFAQRRGLSGSLSVTTGRAISTPPFTGGLFLGQDAVDLLSAGPFAIDHDQRLSVHGTAQASLPAGLWTGLSVRYDSGLVSNPSDPAVVAADPDFADLLPFVDLEGRIPRVRPRTIADLSIGRDVMKGGRRVWSLQAQVTNLTNRTALYNFQSVFVGTRLVQPRTLAVRLRRHF